MMPSEARQAISLPSTGGFSSQYVVELVAIGGQWPYRWSLVPEAGLLPPGRTSD